MGGSFKSTRPPGSRDSAIGSAPGAASPLAWRNMSLRHVPLRGMGWSRNPTSSGVAQQNRNQRVRRRPLYSRTKRRSEHSEHTPSLLQKKVVFITRTMTPACSGSVHAKGFFEEFSHGEK